MAQMENVILKNGLIALPEVILFIFSIWIMFYFLYVKPHKLKLKQRQHEQSQAKVGTWVLLQSGLCAKILKVADTHILVSASNGTSNSMTYLKTAIVKCLEQQPEFNND